jgi:hypothetical protein
MLKIRSPAARASRHIIRNEEAVFIGWQPTRSGVAFALDDITAAGHPSLGSTVTDRSLLKLGLHIPQTPLRPVERR